MGKRFAFSPNAGAENAGLTYLDVSMTISIIRKMESQVSLNEISLA